MSKTDDEEKVFRTMEIRIKEKHPMYLYFEDMCRKSKNLYNISNFYIRQAFTGLKKEDKDRQPNEIEIIDIINNTIPMVNEIRTNTTKKKNLKNNKENKAKLYNFLDSENKFLDYNLLEAVFKITDQTDYISLPSHTNQHVIKQVFNDWKSFYAAIKDYKENPSKYSGCPKIPRYAKKNSMKSCVFTNQTCVIKNKVYLKFPKTKLQLNIGDVSERGKFKEVRVSSNNKYFKVQIIFEVEDNKPLRDVNNIIGIDLGVNNFATITNNIGLTPIIVNGKILKSINQYYNKKRTYYYGILRQGKSQNEGKFNSERLNHLDMKRNDKIKDYMHKASKFVVDYCLENNIDTIVIGHNEDFKKDIKLRKAIKQGFAAIPFVQFIEYLNYKALHKGIRIIITEESYTSKASFADKDIIPVYDKDNEKKYYFSGKRIKRGLYTTSTGTIINADCNGSGNIIRKAVPNAFESRGDRGVMDTPLTLSIV